MDNLVKCPHCGQEVLEEALERHIKYVCSEANKQVKFKCQASDLALAIKEVRMAAITNNRGFTDRPILHGIYFEASAGQITLTASDGCTLATVSIPGEVAQEGTGLVTAKGLKVPKKGEVDVRINSSDCLIVSKDGQATYPILLGDFPNYRKVIPEEKDMMVSVLILSKEFLDAIKTIKLEDVNNALRIYTTDDGLKFVTKDEEGATKEWQFKAMIEGEGKIAVNHKYLTDIAKVCGAFTLQWAEPPIKELPMPMRVATDRGIHVIMPLNVEL